MNKETIFGQWTCPICGYQTSLTQDCVSSHMKTHDVNSIDKEELRKLIAALTGKEEV